MDFGDILDQWEKQTARAEGKRLKSSAARSRPSGCSGEKSSHPSNPTNDWLGRNGIYDKDAALSPDGENPGRRRHELLRKRPDAFIDLHGLNSDEAWAALEVFFENSREKGYEKLLIIHGKGNHQNTVSRDFVPARQYANNSYFHGNESNVLKETTRQFIEFCSFAGESGYSTSREGGTGATWVILKINARGR